MEDVRGGRRIHNRDFSSLSSARFSVLRPRLRFRYFLVPILYYLQSLVQSFVTYLHDEALASFWRCPDWVGSGS